MQGNTPVEKVLRIAIRKEQEARDFYLELVEQVEDASAGEILNFLAGEELKHKEFLENYLSGGLEEGTLRLTDVVDYRIAEHIEDDPSEKADMDGPLTPKKAFLMAAKKESSAHAFYTNLSQIHPAGPVRDLLLKMAGEELRHKEKMEYLYTNTAFPQTAGG